MQKIILIGRIGKDPEVRNFEGGGKLATSTIAIDESYKNKEGQKVEKTEWLNLVFNGKSADFAERYVTKGMKLFIEGKVRTRSWQTKEGETRYTTEVVVLTTEFCEAKRESAPPPPPEPTQTNPQPEAFGGSQTDEVDSLPF